MSRPLVLIAVLMLGCSDTSPEPPDVADTEEPTDPGTVEDPGSDTPPAVTVSCADYCAGVTAACTDDNAQYASEVSCEAQCHASGLAIGALTDVQANTVGCRQYYAGLALASDAATLCPRAGLGGPK